MNADSGARNLPSGFDFALLVLRIASAIVFLYHGAGILFGVLGGPGPAGFAAYKHWPVIVGYLIGLAQFAGGVAMLFGVLQRLGAVCIMVVMLGAIFTVHIHNGFSLATNGYEFALTEFLLALALFITGPGAYSLAALMPAPFRKL